ncbi:MAG: hypothetical protein HY369_04165 [Candidatus Aenigmarchaeota archaeon]|nr:hypothetical protein [Candidatus Aenigmarchaeota archaeon]
MDARYAEFLRDDPSFETRVGRLAGLLTPDPKGITLLAMEPDVAYGRLDLYQRVTHVAGGLMPPSGHVWRYLDGDYGMPGLLHQTGAVRQAPDKTYVKTVFGAEIGDALAARGIRLSASLRTRSRSLTRILGEWRPRKDTPITPPYGAYIVIGLLMSQPDRTLSMIEVTKSCPEISKGAVQRVVYSLGEAGIITYEPGHGMDKARVGANASTPLVWRELVSPIGTIAEDGNADGIPDFSFPLRAYREDPTRMQHDVQDLLTIYERERTMAPPSSTNIDQILLSLAERHTFSHLEAVRQVNMERLAADKNAVPDEAVQKRLDRLLEEGKLVETRRGACPVYRSSGPTPEAERRRVETFLAEYRRVREAQGETF